MLDDPRIMFRVAVGVPAAPTPDVPYRFKPCMLPLQLLLLEVLRAAPTRPA